MTEPEGEPDGRRHRSSRRGKAAFAVFALTARGLEQVTMLVVALLAARFLLPAEYGIYSLAVIFVTLIQTLTYTGFYHFVITSPADDRKVVTTSFWMICGLGTAGALVMVALAWPLSILFKAPVLAWVLALLALAQPIASVEAWCAAVLLRRQAVKRHFGVMFAQNVVGLIAGILMLWLWQSVFALVAFRFVRVLVGTGLYLAVLDERPGWQFDRALAREASSFSGWLYGSRFLIFMARYAADLVLGVTFSTAEAGLYRFGNRVASGATDIVVQPMRSFAQTQLGAAGRTGQPMETALKRFAGTVTILAGSIASVIVVFAPDLIALLFQPAYLAASTVTLALAIRAVLSIGPFLLEPVMAARGRTETVMYFNIYGAIVSVVSVLLAAPFGLNAVAWSQAAVGALLTLGSIYAIARAGNVGVGPALVAFGTALCLVLAYAWALTLIRSALLGAIDSPPVALAAGLAAATALGLATIAIASRLRVFHLSAFSG